MQAVGAARGAWGERAVTELDAEDRLAVACERAPTQDPVIAKLRAAFQVRVLLSVFLFKVSHEQQLWQAAQCTPAWPFHCWPWAAARRQKPRWWRVRNPAEAGGGVQGGDGQREGGRRAAGRPARRRHRAPRAGGGPPASHACKHIHAHTKTTPHVAQESRRIDNQLRGRSGRQGDPGSTRFFLSLEDKCVVLARLFYAGRHTC